MNQIKTLIYSIKKSVTTPTYYKDVLKTDFWFSYKYFLGVCMVIAGLYAIHFLFITAPEIRNTLKLGVADIVNYFPEDLVIESKDGVIKTNRDLQNPLIIAAPDYLKSQTRSQLPTNIIVFDEDGTVEDLTTLDTLILVNNVNFLIRTPEGFESRPTKNLPNFEINKTSLKDQIRLLEDVASLLPYFGFFAVFLMSFVTYGLFRFLDIITIGFLAWIFSKLFGSPISINNSLKITCHTFTIPALVEFGTRLGGFAYTETAITIFVLNIVLTLAIIYYLKRTAKTD